MSNILLNFVYKVYIGTKQGDIMVMDLHGNPVTRVELAPDTHIARLEQTEVPCKIHLNGVFSKVTSSGK